jgi:predicted PurR-regulated permease PerM
MPATIHVIIHRRTLLVIVGVVGAIWLGAHLADILIVLFAALLLAAAVERPAAWLQQRHVPRPLGVLLIFAVAVLVLAGVTLMLVPLIQTELLTLEDRLPRDVTNLERLINRLAPSSARGGISLAALAQQLSSHAGSTAARLSSITLAVTKTLALGFATLVTAYFLALDPTATQRLLSRFLAPPTQQRVAEVEAALRHRIGAWARGQILLAALFGAAMGLGLWIIGIPYAVSLAAAAAVLELIPYAGGAVTIVLASLLALTIGWPQTLGVIVLYIILVNLETHVLAPVLLGHAVGLPPAAVLLALLAGLELRGIIGVLLAVPTAVIGWALVEALWPKPNGVVTAASQVSGEVGAPAAPEAAPADQRPPGARVPSE